MSNSYSKYEPVSCPRCKGMVKCAKAPHCWCFEVEILPKVKEYIEANYDGCLCKSCIEQLNIEIQGKA